MNNEYHKPTKGKEIESRSLKKYPTVLSESSASGHKDDCVCVARAAELSAQDQRGAAHRSQQRNISV